MKKFWLNLIIDTLKPELFANRNKPCNINTDILERLMKERDVKDEERRLRYSSVEFEK